MKEYVLRDEKANVVTVARLHRVPKGWSPLPVEWHNPRRQDQSAKPGEVSSVLRGAVTVSAV